MGPRQALEPYDGYWYVVADAAGVRPGQKPSRLEVFGVVLVLWGTADGELTCPYHGLRFASDGRCVKLAGEPEKDQIPRQLRARRWATREQDGWVFLL